MAEPSPERQPRPEEANEPFEPVAPSAGEVRSPESDAQMTATDITSYLIAGPLAFGGLGMLGDRWLHTAYLTPTGILVGLGLSIYLIWFRYGRRGPQ